jgi:guanosine-3',5'-bis(diphosphate) 3'-pyrophosphohydrolase
METLGSVISAAKPPADWSPERKAEYFDWARSVIEGVRGVHPKLEAVFDKAYGLRNNA